MTLKNKAANNHGQALIESLVLSTSLIAMLSVLSAIVYFALVHVGVNYLLHEFLVCAGTQGEMHCQKDFTHKAATFLFAAKLTRFESTKNFNEQRVRVTLRMPMNRSLKMQKEIELYR